MMMVGHTIGGDNDYDAVYDDDDDDVVVCDDGSSSSIKVDKVIAGQTSPHPYSIIVHTARHLARMGNAL